jgi:hypothetical protein
MIALDRDTSACQTMNGRAAASNAQQNSRGIVTDLCIFDPGQKNYSHTPYATTWNVALASIDSKA